MAIYERLFTLVDVADIHLLFQRRIAAERLLASEARAVGVRVGPRVFQIEKAYADWQLDLEKLAIATAALAKERIVKRIEATAKRPDTGISPHLRDVIVCRMVMLGGFVTGQVGVADEAELNKAVNILDPQRRPYWRAQEYGNPALAAYTQTHPVFGAFFGTSAKGTGFVPASSEAGVHPLFVTVGQGAGAPFGRLVVEHAPQARHFIRDGADQALIFWRQGIRRAEINAIARLRVPLGL